MSPLEETSKDFRSEIAELAESARKEIVEKREAGRPARERKRLSTLLQVGGLLVALEAAALGVHYYLVHQTVAGPVARPAHPLESANNCQGVQYRTFQALVAWRRERGSWPADLTEVVDAGYLAQLPVVPETGQPLAYTRTGEAFRFGCPGVSAAAR